MSTPLKRTPLYEEHLRLGARLTDFGGWEMPLHYGSQIDEHHRVRREAGMFDVSHMLAIDVEGPGAQEFLRRLLANDVEQVEADGKGTLFLHAGRRWWRTGRSDHLLPGAGAVPARSQCRHCGQGSGLDRKTTRRARI